MDGPDALRQEVAGLQDRIRALRAQIAAHAAVDEDLRVTTSERDALQVKLEALGQQLEDCHAHAVATSAAHAAVLRQEREETQKLRQALAARDRALGAASAAAEDAAREAARHAARLAAAQAALQRREADFQALRAALRAKENEALQLEVRLASQAARLTDLELAGREAAAAAAAASSREQALTQMVAELQARCAAAEEAAARRVEQAVAAALGGVAAQVADAEAREAAAQEVAQDQDAAAQRLEGDVQAQQEQLAAMAAQLDVANGALIDAAVERDEAHREAVVAAALQSDTGRRLRRAEASLAAASDSVSALQRRVDVTSQLGEKAAECSRVQADALAATRLSDAAGEALRGEQRAADTLRRQLQEAAAALAPLQDIEERHMALVEELAGATARVERLTDAMAAADQQNAQLAIDLQAAEAEADTSRARANDLAQQATRSANEKAACQEQLVAATAKAAAARRQAAQLHEAHSASAAQLEALQSQHASLQTAHAGLGDELRDQQRLVAEARDAAGSAASEQAAYVQMTTEVISTLGATAKQLEAHLATEAKARLRAEADCAGRDRAAQESGAALEQVCLELRRVQGGLRRQTGAMAFHRKFAGELSVLLQDARGALAELHLTVAALMADRHPCSGGGSGNNGAYWNSNGNDGGGGALMAANTAVTARSAARLAQHLAAEKALARAAACHGGLPPLGRRRTARAVQTAACELWAMNLKPSPARLWGRGQLRAEVHDVLVGSAPPDVSLWDLAAAAAPGSDAGGGRPSNSSAAAAGAPVTAAQPMEDENPAAVDWALRRTPSLAATVRAVQEVHAAKVSAHAAARAARKHPLTLRAFVRPFMEQQHGSSSMTAATHMFDLVAGVAAHAAANPTIAAFGLAAGILRDGRPEGVASAACEEEAVIDVETCSQQGSWPDDGSASQLRLPASDSTEADCDPQPDLNGSVNGHNSSVAAGRASTLELDPRFWQQQQQQPTGRSIGHSDLALQLLHGHGCATFTRLPLDPARLLQPRPNDGSDGSDQQVSAQLSLQDRPDRQQQRQQQQRCTKSVGRAAGIAGLPQLRPVRDWAAVAHPSAGGILCELLAAPGMETALETLAASRFLEALLQDCGLCISEQQAPRLYCMFTAACAAVGLPRGADGPRLYVTTSTETAIYCTWLPLRQTAVGHAEADSSTRVAADGPPAASQGGPLAALRVSDAAALQRSHSAPPGAEAEGGTPSSVMQQGGVCNGARPQSSSGAVAAPGNASSGVQLDRSRWRGGGVGRHGQPPPQRQPEMALAVILTGALVDLLQVAELQAAMTAALGLAVMPPPGPAQAPWTAKLPPSVAAAGDYAEPEGGDPGVLTAINAAFQPDFGSAASFDGARTGGLQLTAASTDARRLAGFREAAQPLPDAVAASAAAWRRLGPAIGAAGLAPAAAEAALAAAGAPRPATLLATLQRAGRHLSLCADRVALAATGNVGLAVSTLMKMTCGAATLEGQLSVDSLLQEARSLDGHAAARKANTARTDGGSAVCSSLAVLRARELLNWSAKLQQRSAVAGGKS